MLEKQCKDCKEVKPLSMFHRNCQAKDGYLNTCKACYKTVYTKRGITLEEYPKRMYNNQRQNSKKRGRPYPNYSYEEFKEYLFKETNYKELYKAYEESGFDKYLAPSTDRKNPLGNYTFDNIQIITWQDNNRKGADEAHLTTKPNKVIHYQLNGEVRVYDSIIEASEKTNTKQGHISRSCNYELNKYPNGIFRYKTLGESRCKRLSKKLIKLIKQKRKVHGNKGKMSPKQEAHLRYIQEQNRLRYNKLS